MITKVNDNLYRGPRPTKETILELQKLGVRTLVDLESGFYEYFHDDDYKKMNLANYNMTEVDLSCSDIFPPKDNVVQSTIFEITMDGPTYVHCLHGQDRTGYVIAAYRMQVMNWDIVAAVKEMFSFGFHKFPYIFWLISLRKYEVKK